MSRTHHGQMHRMHQRYEDKNVNVLVGDRSMLVVMLQYREIGRFVEFIMYR